MTLSKNFISVPHPYLWSTTIVPPFKNLEKTKGASVPLEYHYSTSILEVDPFTFYKKLKTTIIYRYHKQIMLRIE